MYSHPHLGDFFYHRVTPAIVQFTASGSNTSTSPIKNEEGEPRWVEQGETEGAMGKQMKASNNVEDKGLIKREIALLFAQSLDEDLVLKGYSVEKVFIEGETKETRRKKAIATILDWHHLAAKLTINYEDIQGFFNNPHTFISSLYKIFIKKKDLTEEDFKEEDLTEEDLKIMVLNKEDLDAIFTDKETLKTFYSDYLDFRALIDVAQMIRWNLMELNEDADNQDAVKLYIRRCKILTNIFYDKNIKQHQFIQTLIDCQLFEALFIVTKRSNELNPFEKIEPLLIDWIKNQKCNILIRHAKCYFIRVFYHLQYLGYARKWISPNKDLFVELGLVDSIDSELNKAFERLRNAFSKEDYKEALYIIYRTLNSDLNNVIEDYPLVLSLEETTKLHEALKNFQLEPFKPFTDFMEPETSSEQEEEQDNNEEVSCFSISKFWESVEPFVFLGGAIGIELLHLYHHYQQGNDRHTHHSHYE